MTRTAAPVVCHGVTWVTGRPTLLLAGPDTNALHHVDLVGARLGWRVEATGIYCTGRYRFVDTHRVEPVPCPDRAEATRSMQCDRFQNADDFRLAHHAHRGGTVPPALTAYLSQPHWLYIATFAPTMTKVGTVAEPRTRSRLDEQGPHLATYLAKVTDGRMVRLIEDALSCDLGITQSVHRTAKLDALIRPDPPAEHREHHETVARALDLLRAWGVPPDPHPWTRPADAAPLLQPDPQRALYPHDVRQEAHGLHIDACLGSCVLARLRPDDPIHYLADLSRLRGRALSLGDHASPPTTTQAFLF